MRKVKFYKCPECGKKYQSLGGWATHINTMHPGIKPEGFSDSRYFYYVLTGKKEGRCIECHSPTDWNEATGKYNRFCNNPNCKKSYVKLAKGRMINKYGREYLLNDPEMQRKMLLSKKISGYYTFSDGSGKLGYVGSYEKDFLQMMDMFMGYSAKDIMSPSPHTYFYEYEGAQHFYIPDYYIPNLNLEIEIKAQDNTHPKIQAVDKVKERLKDEMMEANPKVNYLKINDKDYKSFFDYLLNLKDSVDETTLDKNTVKLSEVNQALESLDYGSFIDDEPSYDYDPHLCALREGVFIERELHEEPIGPGYAFYFIFYTTTDEAREIGYVTGFDKFSRLAIGFHRKGDSANIATSYIITPEFDSDVAARIQGAYIKRVNADQIVLEWNPHDTSNEYMVFAVNLPDVLPERVFEVLGSLEKSHTPLTYEWDKIAPEWVNHFNKYHYMCYSILRMLNERCEQYDYTIPLTDSDSTPSSIALVDRGLMCELNYERVFNRIDDVFDRYGHRPHPAVETVNTLEETGYYKRLPENVEKLFYQHAFSDVIVNPPQAHTKVEPVEESIQLHTNFNKVKIKGSKDLTKYRKIILNQGVLDQYKEKCPSFGHCRISNASKGYLWVDKSDNIVGFVNVVRKNDGIKWIQALNLQPNYQGYGLYEQLLKVAVRELGGTDIETPPKNDTAKEVYKKFGFEVYTDEESRRCMSIRADAARSKYGNKAKTNATNMTEAGLFPVYVILTNADSLAKDYLKLLTRSTYYHVSLAFDASMSVVYSFGTKDGHVMLPISDTDKNLMINLKADPEASYALYVKIVDRKDFESISSKVKQLYEDKNGFKYELPGAVKSRMDDSEVNEKSYFCSGLVSYLLGEDSTHDIPDINNIHLVDMGLVKDYDKSYIDKKVQSVYEKYYMNKEKDADKQPIEDDDDLE